MSGVLEWHFLPRLTGLKGGVSFPFNGVLMLFGSIRTGPLFTDFTNGSGSLQSLLYQITGKNCTRSSLPEPTRNANII